MNQTINGLQALNGWRTESMYTFSEAAHLANVSTHNGQELAIRVHG